MTSTYVNYQIIASNLPRSIERVADQPLVSRETEYYQSRIADIKTIDDFMADERIYNYALKAHGLEDMAYAKAFIRKILEDRNADGEGFATRLSDARYGRFAAVFDFARFGETTTSFTRTQQGTVDLYMRQTLEEQAGEDDTGVRLALYFERNAASITNVFGILADEAIAQVVRTALGIPQEVAASDIDKQAAFLESRIDIADFQDPEKVAQFLQRFTALWELENANNLPANALLAPNAGFGISGDLLMQINSLRRGG